MGYVGGSLMRRFESTIATASSGNGASHTHSNFLSYPLANAIFTDGNRGESVTPYDFFTEGESKFGILDSEFGACS